MAPLAPLSICNFYAQPLLPSLHLIPATLFFCLSWPFLFGPALISPRRSSTLIRQIRKASRNKCLQGNTRKRSIWDSKIRFEIFTESRSSNRCIISRTRAASSNLFRSAFISIGNTFDGAFFKFYFLFLSTSFSIIQYLCLASFSSNKKKTENLIHKKII